MKKVQDAHARTIVKTKGEGEDKVVQDENQEWQDQEWQESERRCEFGVVIVRMGAVEVAIGPSALVWCR